MNLVCGSNPNLVGQNLAVLDVFALGAAQHAHVVACPNSLRNISNVNYLTVLMVGRRPTTSTSSPTLTMPRSTVTDRAAARDREHVFDRHQEGRSDDAPAAGIGGSLTVFDQGDGDLELLLMVLLIVVRDLGRTLGDRDVVSAGECICTEARGLPSDQFEQVPDRRRHLTLLRYTTSAGTPTWKASRICSRVCGIGPFGC